MAASPVHAYNQAAIEENSYTVGIAQADVGLSVIDQSQEFTQGSMSCPTRNDVMHDPLLQGIKKRKVTTPVVVCSPVPPTISMHSFS